MDMRFKDALKEYVVTTLFVLLIAVGIFVMVYKVVLETEAAVKAPEPTQSCCCQGYDDCQCQQHQK